MPSFPQSFDFTACYAVKCQVQMSLAKVTHMSQDEKLYLAKSFAVLYYTFRRFLVD